MDCFFFIMRRHVDAADILELIITLLYFTYQMHVSVQSSHHNEHSLADCRLDAAPRTSPPSIRKGRESPGQKPEYGSPATEPDLAALLYGTAAEWSHIRDACQRTATPPQARTCSVICLVAEWLSSLRRLVRVELRLALFYMPGLFDYKTR